MDDLSLLKMTKNPVVLGTRIRDVRGRAAAGEAARRHGGRRLGTGREWYESAVHAITIALPNTTNRSAKA